MPYVNDQPEVMQEEDGLFDIGNNEYPPEGTTQPNVEGAGAYTIRRDRGTVHRLQSEDALWA